MGKENKEKSILSPEETAALLRDLADRISGVGPEFDKDLVPSNGAFRKLKLSLKGVRDSNLFVVKCKVKPAYERDSKGQPPVQRQDHPTSMD
jgi:hypothetical protein